MRYSVTLGRPPPPHPPLAAGPAPGAFRLPPPKPRPLLGDHPTADARAEAMNIPDFIQLLLCALPFAELIATNEKRGAGGKAPPAPSRSSRSQLTW